MPSAFEILANDHEEVKLGRAYARPRPGPGAAAALFDAVVPGGPGVYRRLAG
jgi:hypothetical protein